MNALKEKLLIYRLETRHDPDAFAELYDFYHNPIHRFIYFKVPGSEIAEDITAEVFLKLWTHVMENRRITNFRALAYQIARNTVADHYRAARPTATLEDVAELETLVMVDMGSTLGGPIGRDALIQALSTLKPEYTELIVLFYIEEVSIKEIATIVNKRAGAVRVQLHRAIRALKEVIEKSPPQI